MQKIGIETANYKPTLKVLKNLSNYNTIYEYKSEPEIFDMLSPYKNKLVILQSNTEITKHFY